MALSCSQPLGAYIKALRRLGIDLMASDPAELMLAYRMASGVLASCSAHSGSCKLSAISETKITNSGL